MTANFAAVKPRLHCKEKTIAVKKAKIIDKKLSCLTVSATGKLNIVKKQSELRNQ